MNTKNLAASLLPVVFALASFGTVGCAADAETAGNDVVAEREPSAAVMPAEALAGSAKMLTVAAPAPAADARVGATANTLRLVVTDKDSKVPVIYDVLGFDFGVDAAPVVSASGGPTVSRPTLRPFNVVVRTNPKSAVLAKSLTFGRALASVVLQRLDAAGKPIDIAQLDMPAVSRMVTEATDETQEKYELRTRVLTVKESGAVVTVDVAQGTSSCTGSCTCAMANPGQLGPYTQSGPLGTVAPGSAPIDEVSVELHNDIVLGAKGASSSKPVLDGITIERSLEATGLCAMYYAGTGKHVVDLRIGVAGPVQPNGQALESTTWDACYATVTSIGFSGASGDAPREEVGLAAGGLVRTDRSFDPITGVALKGTTTNGWSFVRNASIATCSATLL